MLYQFKNPDRSRYRCQLPGQPGFIAHGHPHSQHLSAQQVACLPVKGCTPSLSDPRRPRCTSHQAVPAHGGQSGEASDNCLVQIADGHFISARVGPPGVRYGVVFVPLQGHLIGLCLSQSLIRCDLLHEQSGKGKIISPLGERLRKKIRE